MCADCLRFPRALSPASLRLALVQPPVRSSPFLAMFRSLRSLVAVSASFTAAPTATATAAPSAIARAAATAVPRVRATRALTTFQPISSAAASVCSASPVPAAVPFRASAFLHPRHRARRSFSTIESLPTGPLGASGPSDDPHARFVVLYTCKVCETRSAKSVSRQAYSSGVVLLRCDGCSKHHLFADHLGWFEDEGTDIESILAAKGVAVGRSSINLKPEELQQLEALQKQMQQQAAVQQQRKKEAEEKLAATDAANAGDEASAFKADAHAPEADVAEPAPRLK